MLGQWAYGLEAIKGVIKFCIKDKSKESSRFLKTIFHLRREAKTIIQQRGWLTLVGEKYSREQVGTVATFFLLARTNSPSGKQA